GRSALARRLEPQPGIETGSAAYKAAASPQCFRGKKLRTKLQIDKRTALPLRIPKKGAVAQAPSNSGRSRCQTAKAVRVVHARGGRAHDCPFARSIGPGGGGGAERDICAYAAHRIPHFRSTRLPIGPQRMSDFSQKIKVRQVVYPMHSLNRKVFAFKSP